MESLRRNSDDPKQCVAVIIQAARVLIRTLRQMVRAEPSVARRALLPVLNRREKIIKRRVGTDPGYDVDSEADIFSRVVDLLYLTLAAEGVLHADAVRNPDSQGVAPFLARFEHAASDLTVLAMFALSMRRGELLPLLREGILGLAKGPRHTLVAEWRINQRKLSRGRESLRVSEIFPDTTTRVHELFLGFTARDVLELSRDEFASLRDDAGVRRVREAILIDVARMPEKTRRILAATTLAIERVMAFDTPFFFDLGRRPKTPATVDEAILWAAARNWSYYYPFLALPDGNAGHQWVVTNQGTVVTFLANLYAQKNGLLDKIHMAADTAGSKDLDTIRVLQQDSSRELEQAAVESGTRVGWISRHVSSVQGKRLPCGDIDALFGLRLASGEVVVVLAEMKDADYMPHKDDLFDELHERPVRKALAQLQHKAQWLLGGWGDGLGSEILGTDFGPETRGRLLKLLVTRVLPPLYLINTAESVTLDHLERYLSRLRTGLPAWIIERRQSSMPLGIR